jgi:hypothetical protein
MTAPGQSPIHSEGVLEADGALERVLLGSALQRLHEFHDVCVWARLAFFLLGGIIHAITYSAIVLHRSALFAGRLHFFEDAIKESMSEQSVVSLCITRAVCRCRFGYCGIFRLRLRCPRCVIKAVVAPKNKHGMIASLAHSH